MLSHEMWLFWRTRLHRADVVPAKMYTLFLLRFLDIDSRPTNELKLNSSQTMTLKGEIVFEVNLKRRVFLG
jgi:hypothetical protein